MDWRLMMMAGMALLIMIWFGMDAYLRIRALSRGVALEDQGAASVSHVYVVAACRITVVLGVPAFVIAYGAGADIMWAVAGPPVVLLTCGFVEWGTTRWVFDHDRQQAGSVDHKRLGG